MMRGREGRLGRRAQAELLTKERDSVTDKSGKLAEEADDRERNGRTRETEIEDSKGTRTVVTQLEAGTGKEGQKTEPGGRRMIGKKTKETEGVGKGRGMSKPESHEATAGMLWGGEAGLSF